MLVYANSLVLEPANGPADIVQLVAKWIGQRAQCNVDPGRLAEGIRELRLRDGSVVSSRATVDGNLKPEHPYYFCARLVHADDRVSGRRWVTEVGLRQDAEGKAVECSVALNTEEISARVTSLIQVTRPKLILDLVESGHPAGQTPGLKVKRLDEVSALAFLSEVERLERRHPIVLISAGAGGAYPVIPDRLRSIVLGLADLVEVATEVDTFALEKVVGRRYMAFGGAINIVFPARQGDRGLFCETVLLRPAEIEAIQQDGRNIDSEVLAAITHRTNIPSLWRHTSMEMVGQAVLRSQLARALAKANASEESSGYAALLESAMDQMTSKDSEIADLREKLEASGEQAVRLEADVAGLKHALGGRQASDADMSEDATALLVPLRQAISAVLGGDPSLEQGLELIGTLYGDRIVVLESAAQAARESDKKGFRFGSKGFDLMTKLATHYWQALADGKGDQQAKIVFGQKAYAAAEASTLSIEGKRRRTFVYLGRPMLMEKHLKHGVKDSSAETLRVHFEWIASDKKIVIGHCGKHLDF